MVASPDNPSKRTSQLTALAKSQHGLITRRQALALGYGAGAIKYRCAEGSWFPVHSGVYALGRPPTTPLERAAAAVLACGEGAALSHGSALTLWGMQERWSREPLHVTVPRDRRRPGLTVHVVPALTRPDIRVQLGVRATSPARTVLDCARSLGTKRLRRVVADGRRAGLLHVGQIQDVLERFPRHPGRAALAAQLTDSAPTRSEFEDLFVAFCARHELPAPETTEIVCGHEVDVLFRAANLVVELDGYDFHRDKAPFESDRERDAQLLQAGLSTYRLTWTRFIATPQREAERLGAILSART